jgi:hypothetical protein
VSACGKFQCTFGIEPISGTHRSPKDDDDVGSLADVKFGAGAKVISRAGKQQLFFSLLGIT